MLKSGKRGGSMRSRRGSIRLATVLLPDPTALAVAGDAPSIPSDGALAVIK